MKKSRRNKNKRRKKSRKKVEITGNMRKKKRKKQVEVMMERKCFRYRGFRHIIYNCRNMGKIKRKRLLRKVIVMTLGLAQIAT